MEALVGDEDRAVGRTREAARCHEARERGAVAAPQLGADVECEDDPATVFDGQAGHLHSVGEREQPVPLEHTLHLSQSRDLTTSWCGHPPRWAAGITMTGGETPALPGPPGPARPPGTTSARAGPTPP